MSHVALVCEPNRSALGMDVHQDTVTLAVFEGASKEAAVVQKLPRDLRKATPIRRIVVRMEFGDFSMLFPGDAETEERTC